MMTFATLDTMMTFDTLVVSKVIISATNSRATPARRANDGRVCGNQLQVEGFGDPFSVVFTYYIVSETEYKVEGGSVGFQEGRKKKKGRI